MIYMPFFENGPITKQFIWDKGVNQLVTMASFDHFAQILLIQIVLIAVFFGVAFYVFQKSDMAKRNNFMYFPWMEHLFVWIFPFCVSLFIVVTGFKIQSYTGGILAAVIATIIDYHFEGTGGESLRGSGRLRKSTGACSHYPEVSGQLRLHSVSRQHGRCY